MLLRSAEIQPVFQRFVLLCLRITPLLPLSPLNYMVPTARAGWDPTKCPAYLLLLLLLVATSLVGPTRLQVSTLRFYWSLQDYKTTRLQEPSLVLVPFKPAPKPTNSPALLATPLPCPAKPCPAKPCLVPSPAQPPAATASPASSLIHPKCSGWRPPPPCFACADVIDRWGRAFVMLRSYHHESTRSH